MTVAAYIDNEEVAVDEISLVNVSDGLNGPKGDKGDPGKDGVAGKNGVGLHSTVITYAPSTSGTNAPNSGWASSVPVFQAGQYLWTKTTWNYTDNTSETGYSVARIGRDGNTGRDGVAGKDGVGIRATAVVYASSTSGTVPPSSGWHLKSLAYQLGSICGLKQPGATQITPLRQVFLLQKWVKLAKKEIEESQDLEVLKVIEEKKAKRESEVYKVSKVCKAQKVTKAFLE